MFNNKQVEKHCPLTDNPCRCDCTFFIINSKEETCLLKDFLIKRTERKTHPKRLNEDKTLEE